MFFSRETEKPVKPVKPVDLESQNGGQRPHHAGTDLVEENSTLKSHQETKHVPDKKRKLSSNVQSSNVKHTGKNRGSGKDRKMNTSEEVVPAKKLKRIIVVSDSENSSDDGECSKYFRCYHYKSDMNFCFCGHIVLLSRLRLAFVCGRYI
jgi:hypothetical protein